MKHNKHEESSSTRVSEDVIHEILLRLPSKSLGRCKLVSKTWNSLISSPEFAKAHLRYSRLIGNSSSLLALQRYNIISLVKFDSSTDMDTDKGAEDLIMPLDHQFEPRLCGGHYQFLIGSCDGLVCIYLKKRGRAEDMMFLWNPMINKHEQIPLPAEQGLTYLLADSCWFGFVPSSNTYKILLVYNAYRPMFVERMYAYSLRDHKWSELRETSGVGGEEGRNHPTFTSGSKAVLMNEALHYLAVYNSHSCIHKLDLVSETFERIPFSIKPQLLPRSCRILLGVIGENKCLCAMAVHYSEKWMSDVWILEEYNKWDSWKKMYVVDLQTSVLRSDHFLGFTGTGYLCIGVQGLKLVDPSHYPPLYVNFSKCCLQIYQVIDHVESLISPLSLP